MDYERAQPDPEFTAGSMAAPTSDQWHSYRLHAILSTQRNNIVQGLLCHWAHCCSGRHYHKPQ